MDPLLVAAIAPILTFALSALGFTAASAYAIFRLKSTQIIREKIWNFCVGDKYFFDEKLSSYDRDQFDLARFRVLYGVQARSVVDLHRLLSWIERHKLIPGEIKRVRKWIDPSRAEVLKVPTAKYFVRRGGIIILLVPMLMGLMSAAQLNITMFRMNVSGTWFKSDGKIVNGVWRKWQIDSHSCRAGALPASSTTDLTNSEAGAICNAISNNELQTMVDESLRSQRRGFGISLLLASLFQLGITFNIATAAQARKLGIRLHSDKTDTTNDGRFRKRRVPALR